MSVDGHTHIRQGDTPGCPPCDRAARRPAPAQESVPAAPVEPDLSEYPLAGHRITEGRFVCDGDETSRCHQYPNSCGCEFWPCGHPYESHAECWVVPWVDASYLADSHIDPDRLEFPDGAAWWRFEDEYVIWGYIDEPTGEPA